MADIKTHLNNIKGALFGKDVRGSIHDGIDAINKEVENTTGRQVDLENTFDQLVINAGNSNTEIVDARVKNDGTSYSKLGDRLDAVDSQLAHIENKTNDCILISPQQYSNITNDILEAFGKYNHVKISKGTYYIDKVILPKDNLILDSEDGAVLILNELIGIYVSEKKNITIKNVKIDGNEILHPSNIENGSSAIYFSSCDNIIIENVKTVNTGAWGIVVTNYSTNININNCDCSGSIRQSGIAISGNCDNFSIVNNKTYSNFYAGIIVEPDCNNGFITNNISYENIENGIIIAHNQNANIDVSNNILKNNEKLGITCVNSSLVNISNNMISNNGTSGIYCTDITQCTFKNNYIMNNLKCGFYFVKTKLEGQMTDIVVTDNTVLYSCLNANETHEASYFIRDCEDLVFKNNISKSSKKDYTIVGNTFKVLELYKESISNNFSDIGLSNKPFNFKLKLNSSNRKISITAPYDMKIYGYTLKRKITSTSQNGTMYTLIKLNDNDYGKHRSEEGNVGNILYSSYLGQKTILKDEVFSISYVHSYNIDYIDDVEIELLYY